MKTKDQDTVDALATMGCAGLILSIAVLMWLLRVVVGAFLLYLLYVVVMHFVGMPIWIPFR